MRWSDTEPLLDQHFQIARTSAPITAYNKDQWINKYYPIETRATKLLFEKEINHHKDQFTDESHNDVDHHNLYKIYLNVRNKVGEVEAKHKHSINKSTARSAREDASHYFHAIVEDLTEKQQYFLFSELKTDFLEYLLMPFYSFTCCKFTKYELDNSGKVEAFIIGMLLLCFLFYALCFWWLWLGAGVLQNADATLKEYLTNHCQVIPIGKLETYFTFRLAVYFIAPLSLIAIAVASHVHQRVLLQRLTGIPTKPHADQEFNTPSYWNNRVPIGTTIIVMVINVLFGAATMALDILLLQGFQRWAVSDVDKGCHALVHGMMVDQPPAYTAQGNTTTTPAPTERIPTSTLNIKPTLADLPIPLLTFNILYTLWGVLYVLAVSWCRPDLISDVDTTLVDDLGLSNDMRTQRMHESMARRAADHSGKSTMTHNFISSVEHLTEHKKNAEERHAATHAIAAAR
jgi:hypothetical protein